MAEAEPLAPAVSITLATWNGVRWLPALLASIAAQTCADYELIIVDDHSTDGTVDWLRTAAVDDGRIRLESLSHNVGYARAQNRAMRRARGEAVLVLNQDLVLHPEYLARSVATLREHPRSAAVQGRILRLGANGERTLQVDTTGLLLGRDRRAVSRDQLRPDGALDRPAGPVWGADGPAPVYRRAALMEVRQSDLDGRWEVFDSDFIMQKEDVDLAWRLRRHDWVTRYEPTALAWHARGGASTGEASLTASVRANMENPLRVRVLAWRNQHLMLLKNDELRSVLHDLPWIARRELAMWVWVLVADQRRLSAVRDLFRLAPRALRKRRALRRASARRARAT